MTTPADGLPSNYRFADLTLDVARRRVTRQGQPIELKALDFDLLRFLVEQAPNVINADVLAEKVWGRHFVSPENVAQRVMLLRQSLADDANKPRYIETIRNKGYRLIPVVQRGPTEAPDATPRRRPLALAATALLAVATLTAAGYWLAGTPEQQQAVPRSVAVLPFENSSLNDDDAFFAASMQDLIVNELTKMRSLRVFPVRTGSGMQRSLADIARDLNVTTALGGRVYYAEGRVLVTPQLTDAATGASLWSNSYERVLSDIFALQSEIALDVAQELSIELSAIERARVKHVATTDPQAYELYLGALARMPTYSREELLLVIKDIEQAVALDAEFKEAWVVNSFLRNDAQLVDPQFADEHRRRGEQAALTALNLDPELGRAHFALGYSLLTKKNWVGAEAEFRKAAALNEPPARLGSYAFLQLSAGKFGDSAHEILEAARAAEPQSPTFYRFLAFVHAGLGDWTRANALYDDAIRLFRTDRTSATALREQKMHWLVGRGDLAQARAVAIEDPLNANMLALDSSEKALAELHRAYEVSAAGNPNHRRDIALWAGHFGDPVLALRAMRAVVDEQGAQMAYVWMPQLKSMRRLPDFKVFMREIGMVDYWEKYDWPPFCRRLDEHDFECV